MIRVYIRYFKICIVKYIFFLYIYCIELNIFYNYQLHNFNFIKPMLNYTTNIFGSIKKCDS